MPKYLNSPRARSRASLSVFAGRIGASALIGIALASVADCASAGPYNPSDLPPPQLSQVQELCHSVMGITPGVRLSSDCVENLSNSAAAQASRRSPPKVQVDTSGLQRPAKSYVNASFDEVRRRERDACARLGYDPIDASFTQCVASLNAALLASAHPMQ